MIWFFCLLAEDSGMPIKSLKPLRAALDALPRPIFNLKREQFIEPVLSNPNKLVAEELGKVWQLSRDIGRIEGATHKSRHA